MNNFGKRISSLTLALFIATPVYAETGVRQQLEGSGSTVTTLNKVLPTLEYSTNNLSSTAQKINNSQWKEGEKIN